MRSLYRICFSNIFFVSLIHYYFFFHRFRHIFIPTRYSHLRGLSVRPNRFRPARCPVRPMSTFCVVCVNVVFILIILFSYIDCIYFTTSVSFFFSLKFLKHDFWTLWQKKPFLWNRKYFTLNCSCTTWILYRLYCVYSQQNSLKISFFHLLWPKITR